MLGIIVPTLSLSAATYEAFSPDKQIKLTLNSDKGWTYKVSKDNQLLITESKIAILTNQYESNLLGDNATANTKLVSQTITPQWGISSSIADLYTELSLNLSPKLFLEFRVYNNGVAWRFVSTSNGELIVKNEIAEFNVPNNTTVYWPKVAGFSNPFESNYPALKATEILANEMALTPIMYRTAQGTSIIISESNLFEYPGMFISKTTENGFAASFANYPTKESEQFLGRMRLVNIPQWSKKMVRKTADFIAKTNGNRSFPWRVIAIESTDKDLLNNQLVYQLADKANQDFSWVKPGKVVWDWYYHYDIENIGFESGINTQTYLYLIDFATRNGIQYVNVDDGWCKLHNFNKVNKDLDLPKVLNYAKDKKVGIFLWCTYQTLENNLLENLDKFSKMGIAGLKVDFFDRSDQKVVDFINLLASEAAKRHLMLNLHGVYKSTGLCRTYPNVMNQEGVLGLEYNKFSNKCTPEHNLTIPFTRNMVGPMDYTPGGMKYMDANIFKKSWKNPHVMTTRAQQMAMYIVYHGGVQMLADAPNLYEQDAIAINYLQQVPVTWDETLPLSAELGKSVVIARRSGQTWYIAGMSANNPTEVDIPLSFLGSNTYHMELITDGNEAANLKRSETTIRSDQQLKLTIKPTGGFVAILKEK